MTQSFIPQAANVADFMPGAVRANPVDVVLGAILTCELAEIEKAIHLHQDDLSGLLSLMEVLGPKISSPELMVTARKFSWKRGSILKWDALCEFRMVRAHRILLIPGTPDFASIVLKIEPGTSGTACCDSPDLLMRQIGRIAAMPSFATPPPFAMGV